MRRPSSRIMPPTWSRIITTPRASISLVNPLNSFGPSGCNASSSTSSRALASTKKLLATPAAQAVFLQNIPLLARPLLHQWPAPTLAIGGEVADRQGVIPAGDECLVCGPQVLNRAQAPLSLRALARLPRERNPRLSRRFMDPGRAGHGHQAALRHIFRM